MFRPAEKALLALMAHHCLYVILCICVRARVILSQTDVNPNTPHRQTVVDSWIPLSNLLPLLRFTADNLTNGCRETALRDMFVSNQCRD